MHTVLRFGLLLLASFVSQRAVGQPASPGPATAPAATAPAELATLERFLSLSDAELAQMAEALARVRAMSQAERATLRDQIAAFRQLSEPQRQRIRQGWGGMPAEIQAGWREMMQHATPEQHAAIQAKLQSLSPEEKMQYRRSLVESYLREQATKK